MYEEIIIELENIIKEHLAGIRDDYTDGLIVGVTIAIKIIENNGVGTFWGKTK